LGCVYSALSQWIREGKPKTSAAGIHRFRQWAACMDWLVQNLFSLPPLLDGHRQVQKEVASDILTFLRQVAIKVEQEGQLGEEFIASALVELAQRHHVTIPGIKDATDENAHKSLGRQMGRCFRDGDTLALDSSFQIVRKATSVKREDGEVLEGRTAMGRRRLVPHEHTEWHRFQAQTNLVVQGSCADILKNALIELVVVLPPAARLIAVVHDEIIVEVKEDVADHVRTVLGYVMKKAAEATLRGVPIEVEAKVCANWGEK
jgi:hypothetical protein